MNCYTITARLYGHYTAEDPKCPSYWRGSGVYDIEVPCTIDIRAEVTAESEEAAEELVMDYDYENDRNNPYCVTVDDVDILSVTPNGKADEEEELDIRYGDCDDIYYD